TSCRSPTSTERPSLDGARLEYDKRVNRVIDHVRAHLAEPLTLADLARVAAFSPFHFHRVFRAITGETLFGFIQRLRAFASGGRADRPSRRERAGDRARSWLRLGGDVPAGVPYP